MEINEITDKGQWEDFLSSNSPASFFQSWQWGEVIKTQSSPGKIQNLWRFGIYDEKKLAGIAQVHKVIAKRGNFFHLRHGPILGHDRWQRQRKLAPNNRVGHGHAL